MDEGEDGFEKCVFFGPCNLCGVSLVRTLLVMWWARQRDDARRCGGSERLRGDR